MSNIEVKFVALEIDANRKRETLLRGYFKHGIDMRMLSRQLSMQARKLGPNGHDDFHEWGEFYFTSHDANGSAANAPY